MRWRNHPAATEGTERPGANASPRLISPPNISEREVTDGGGEAPTSWQPEWVSLKPGGGSILSPNMPTDGRRKSGYKRNLRSRNRVVRTCKRCR